MRQGQADGQGQMNGERERDRSSGGKGEAMRVWVCVSGTVRILDHLIHYSLIITTTNCY